MKHLFIYISLLVALIFPVSAQTNVATLNSTNATVTVSTNGFVSFFDKTSLVLEEEFRIDARDGTFFYEHTDIQGRYAVAPWFDVFASYRIILQDKGNGFKAQSMVVPGVQFKSPEESWGKLSLRSRVEIGFTESPKPYSYQWANFVKYSAPIKLTRFEIQPFIGDEPFFDCADDLRFDRNRIYGGLDYSFTKKIKGSTFYVRQYDKAVGKDWVDSDLIFTQIRFTF